MEIKNKEKTLIKLIHGKLMDNTNGEVSLLPYKNNNELVYIKTKKNMKKILIKY